MNLDAFNAKVLASELSELATPRRVQKFSQLTEHDFLLHLRCPDQTHKLLLSLHPEKSRFHLIFDQHPPAIVPHSFVMLCRKYIGGSGVVSAELLGLDRILRLRCHNGYSLVFDWAGRPSTLLLVREEDGKVLGLYPSRGRYRPGQVVELSVDSKFAILRNLESDWPAEADDIETKLKEAGFPPLWRRRLANLEPAKQKQGFTDIVKPLLEPTTPTRPGLASDGEPDYTSGDGLFDSLHQACHQRWKESSQSPGLSDEKSQLVRTIRKQKDRAQKKLKKRLQDQKGAQRAPQDQLRGDLLLAYASGLKRGAESFDTQDWEGRAISIRLDPKLSATDNAERYYRKAKKKRRALEILGEQIRLAELELEMWDEYLLGAESAETRVDLEQVRLSMPRGRNRKAPRKVPQVPSSGPRKFRHGDFQILVGRNPSQNEKLSLKTAAKDDHWFHVRQGAGSHVLIRCAGKEPQHETIKAAAWLAARYSRSSESDAVEVVTTRGRFLKKAKNGPLGKVIYRQEKELISRPTGAPPEGLEPWESGGGF